MLIAPKWMPIFLLVTLRYSFFICYTYLLYRAPPSEGNGLIREDIFLVKKEPGRGKKSVGSNKGANLHLLAEFALQVQYLLFLFWKLLNVSFILFLSLHFFLFCFFALLQAQFALALCTSLFFSSIYILLHLNKHVVPLEVKPLEVVPYEILQLPASSYTCNINWFRNRFFTYPCRNSVFLSSICAFLFRYFVYTRQYCFPAVSFISEEPTIVAFKRRTYQDVGPVYRSTG